MQLSAMPRNGTPLVPDPSSIEKLTWGGAGAVIISGVLAFLKMVVGHKLDDGVAIRKELHEHNNALTIKLAAWEEKYYTLLVASTEAIQALKNQVVMLTDEVNDLKEKCQDLEGFRDDLYITRLQLADARKEAHAYKQMEEQRLKDAARTEAARQAEVEHDAVIKQAIKDHNKEVEDDS